MELQTAIEILEYHQEWRLGKRDDMIHEPKKLTEALDIVLTEVKKLNKSGVMRRLPSSEDVKRWHQILVGNGDDEMQKDIKATFA